MIDVWWWKRQKRVSEVHSTASDDPFVAYQQWVGAGRPSGEDSMWPWDLGHANTATPDEDERPV